MTKICLIQEELKDKDFIDGKQFVDFQILKALASSNINLDVFCIKNNLNKRLKINRILELSEEFFFQNAFSMANKMDYDLTFATDYFPADIVYLHKHSIKYTNDVMRTKFLKIFEMIFQNKKFKNQKITSYKQKISTQKNSIILTPSTILKNDLINNLHADGQKIYILPPPVEIPRSVKIKNNKIFTFGFIATDFTNKGGYVLLRALKNLSDYDFNVKIIYSYENLPKLAEILIKKFHLEDKIELLPYQENMKDFYKSIDCLLIPSKIESFGLSGLEAMSKGKLVLVSSRCGIKDIIEHDNNGFIFDITQNAVKNLKRNMEYILVNKDDFDNVQQKALYSASVFNFQKFQDELLRIISKFTDKSSEVE